MLREGERGVCLNMRVCQRVCVCVRAVFKHHLVLECGTSPVMENTSTVTIRV